MDIVIDAGEFQLPGVLPSAVRRMIETLKALPAGHVLTTGRLAAQSGYLSPAPVYEVLHHPQLRGWSIMVGRQRYWGAPATLAELARQRTAQLTYGQTNTTDQGGDPPSPTSGTARRPAPSRGRSGRATHAG